MPDIKDEYIESAARAFLKEALIRCGFKMKPETPTDALARMVVDWDVNIEAVLDRKDNIALSATPEISSQQKKIIAEGSRRARALCMRARVGMTE
jgi:hypothetical protein